MLGAADRSYTTAGHRAEQQFDAWRAIVADAFAPVELDSGVGDAAGGFAATALAVPGDRGIGGIASAAFAGLALHADPTGGRAAGSAGVHVVGLLAAALEASMPAPDDRRTALFRAVLEDIESHYGDAELTLRDVAGRVAISPSYLTKLFAENRTSFGRWLLSRRLDHAWIALVQAPWDRSIADIALQCGFHDPGYFARAFRLRFGLTPSERRRSSAPVV